MSAGRFELELIRRHKRLLTVFMFLGLLLAIFELSGLRDNFSLEFLQHRIQENKISGLLIFILLYSLGNLIQIPGWIFLAAAVLALGKIGGGVASYVAATVSCVITFFIIRYVGGDALRQLNNKFAIRLLSQLDAHPVKSILLLRILFQTVPPLNYALAMSGVKFRHYLVGTLLGLPIPIVVYCLFFDYLAKMLKVVPA